LSRRQYLARGSRSDRREDARANHRANGEHDQIPRPDYAAKRLTLFGVGHQVRDRFSLEELGHPARILT
jgi:hypothetical protein